MTFRVPFFPKTALTLAAVLTLAAGLGAAIRLPAVLGDHMVVQREMPLRVWGWALPGETVTVGFAGSERSGRAAADGTWKVELPPVPAGGSPLEMRIRGTKSPEVEIRDILAGEVWLCSGQSNMEWWLASTFSPVPDILRADQPLIRLFLVPKKTSAAPASDVEAAWARCTPESARTFSAVAYYYGLELQKNLGVPVGLIASAWGGTDIEPWTPPAGFAAVPETRPNLAAVEKRAEEYQRALAGTLPAWEAWVRAARAAAASGKVIPAKPKEPANPFDWPQMPTTLYNAMIHPLVPFGIRGAIWYQGENNRNDTLAYEAKMEALIRGWREVWGQGDFPFYYVQLAPYYYPYNREEPGGDVPDFLRLPLIWEAQSNILRLPHTGMAVITDITDLMDIHPRNKKEVGYRLALWARAHIYGEKDLVFSGPLYRAMTVDGARIRIAFDYVGGGLIANDGQPLRWFEIAGEDHIFYKAAASIEGGEVVVSSPRVPSPQAVRFGWHELAVPNLANREGLPASPFRTDRW